jgi:hypothetical protein
MWRPEQISRAFAGRPRSSRTASRVRPAVPYLLAVFLLACALAGPFLPRLLAQGQSAPGPNAPDRNSSDSPSPDVAILREDLTDIDHLRFLSPLKLTPDQLDRLIAALETARAEYDRKVKELAEPLMRSMSDEIRAVKRQALAGSDPPKEFDDKVRKMEADFLKKRAEVNNQNLAKLGTKFREIVTDQQAETAMKLAKDSATQGGKDAKGSDAQWINFYVLNVFLDNNPRIVPLLKELRKATANREQVQTAPKAAGSGQ